MSINLTTTRPQSIALTKRLRRISAKMLLRGGMNLVLTSHLWPRQNVLCLNPLGYSHATPTNTPMVIGKPPS